MLYLLQLAEQVIIYHLINIEQLCECPLLWSSLEPHLAPGEPIVNLCPSPDYIDTTCNCQDLQNDTTCVVSLSGFVGLCIWNVDQLEIGFIVVQTCPYS